MSSKLGSRKRRGADSPPALVLGTQITALGVIRSLGVAGVHVYQATSTSGNEYWSRYNHRLSGGLPEICETDDLADYLRRLPLDRAVLMPCSDRWNLAVAALPEDVKHEFPCSQPSTETQEMLVDKGHLSRTLTENQVPHPKTLWIATADDLVSCDAAVFEDAFLKPRDSQAFFAQYGVKAFRVHSRDEALQRFAQFQRDGHTVVLQQYIGGGASDHYFVDGFVDRHGTLCGAFARHRLRMFPLDFGNSTYQVTVPLSHVEPCVPMLQRLFVSTAFRGIFSAEFVFDQRDRTFKLLEVNARPWWYIEFAQKCGMPFAYMAYQDALGQDVEPGSDYRVGVSLVHAYYDFFSCSALWKRHELSAWSWARSWLTARHAVFSWRDPMPAVAALSSRLMHVTFRKPWRRRRAYTDT